MLETEKIWNNRFFRISGPFFSGNAIEWHLRPLVMNLKNVLDKEIQRVATTGMNIACAEIKAYAVYKYTHYKNTRHK